MNVLDKVIQLLEFNGFETDIVNDFHEVIVNGIVECWFKVAREEFRIYNGTTEEILIYPCENEVLATIGYML